MPVHTGVEEDPFVGPALVGGGRAGVGEDSSAAVGENGDVEGHGWVEVLPDKEVSVIEGCRKDLEGELGWGWGREGRSGLEGEGVVDWGGLGGFVENYGVWHLY